MPRRTALMAALLALSTLPALGQGATRLNVLGVVQAIDAGTIAVKEDSGAVETFRLAPGVLVLRNRPAGVADIRPDDFVASAAVRGTDGKLHSTELRIFPAALRGAGEGQRPMGGADGQTMTNAVVTGQAVVGGTGDLKVRFAGGESELMVGPEVPITRIETVERDAVKVGVPVRLQGALGEVSRITVR